MSVSKWIDKNTYSLKGKTVAITGSTGGLGGEICKIIAFLGGNLILIDRNYSRSLCRKKQINDMFPEISVSMITADMENIDSVKQAASELQDFPIDFLILNAGAYSIPRRICDTGYDNVFQINFVSQYYLARKLIPLLRERNGKIIAVGSIAHNYSRTDIDDIDFSKRSKSNLVYGNSKRYLMWSLYALCARENMPLSVTHPGITFTNITAHYPPLIFAVIKHPMKVIFMKPQKACLSIIQGLFDNCKENEWIGPKLFDVWGYPRKSKIKTVKKEEYSFIAEIAEQIYTKQLTTENISCKI